MVSAYGLLCISRAVCPGEATRTDLLKASASELVLPGKLDMSLRVRTALGCQIEPQPMSLPADVDKTSPFCRALRYPCHRTRSQSLHTQRPARYSPNDLHEQMAGVLTKHIPVVALVPQTHACSGLTEAPVYLLMILSAALFGLKLAHSDPHRAMLSLRSGPSTSYLAQAGRLELPEGRAPAQSRNLHSPSLTKGHHLETRTSRSSTSRSGPNSRGCSQVGTGSRLLMVTLLSTLPYTLKATAADARVELLVHRWSSGAEALTTPEHKWAKPGESRKTAHKPDFSAQGSIRKRALRRAINRAHNNTDGYTWYRGRRLHHRQLCAGHFRPEQPLAQAPPTLQNHREARTLRMVSLEHRWITQCPV